MSEMNGINLYSRHDCTFRNSFKTVQKKWVVLSKYPTCPLFASSFYINVISEFRSHLSTTVERARMCCSFTSCSAKTKDSFKINVLNLKNGRLRCLHGLPCLVGHKMLACTICVPLRYDVLFTYRRWTDSHATHVTHRPWPWTLV